MFLGYDVEDLWCRCEKVCKDFGIMKMLNLLLDNNFFGYQWDYMDILVDLVLRIFLFKEYFGSFDDVFVCVLFVFEVLQWLFSFRFLQGFFGVLEVFKRFRNYKCFELEDGYLDVFYVFKKFMEYFNLKGKFFLRYLVDFWYLEFLDVIDFDLDIFKG